MKAVIAIAVLTQDRLYAEIQAVVGEGDSDVSLDHLRAMPYLDQVLKESLRKFSPIMTLSRRVQDDLKLSNFFFHYWIIRN